MFIAQTLIGVRKEFKFLNREHLQINLFGWIYSLKAQETECMLAVLEGGGGGQR